MVFRSILFERTEDNLKDQTLEAPAFFVDLNLDQVVDAITSSKPDYNLKLFFYAALNDLDAIGYRQEIFQELENPNVFGCLQTFAQKMRTMRKHLAQADKLYYPYQKKRWFLSAVEIYCEAVNSLLQELSGIDLHSRGFVAFQEHLTSYIQSERFTSLFAETKQLLIHLASIKYSLLIKGLGITVRKYEAEPDYSTEVEAVFEKFKQGAPKDYLATFSHSVGMNHIEAQILDLVAKLFPAVFAALDEYCVKNKGYLEETISRFDREIQFYIAYLDHIAICQRAGLNFCYPEISNQSKAEHDTEGFDLALAYKLVMDKSPIVCNDYYLQDQERILVISGPNQGGKTTFARMFGQLHYLASLGCLVPGRDAQLFLFDHLFTHFEKEESLNNLRGKLEDDLIRLHSILDRATTNSVVILNEIFTSTTVQDALFLGNKVMERIMQLDLLCVFVTFIDELASLSETTVSLVSTVDPENPAVRTYKILRKPADGLAYALAIAEKYRLTHDALTERLKS